MADTGGRTPEQIKENITKAARLARTGTTHPDPGIRAMVPVLHELINIELDRLDGR